MKMRARTGTHRAVAWQHLAHQLALAPQHCWQVHLPKLRQGQSYRAGVTLAPTTSAVTGEYAVASRDRWLPRSAAIFAEETAIDWRAPSPGAAVGFVLSGQQEASR